MPEPKDEFIREAQHCNRLIADIERRARREIERVKRDRRGYLLRANRSGATYDELVERCGVSDGYLAREIRQARREAPAVLRRRPSSDPERRAVSA